MYLSESPISRSIWRRISYGNLGIKVECRRIEEWACGRILGWCQQPCRTFSTHMQIYCLVNYYALVTHREAGAQPRLKSWGGPRFACAQRPAKGRAVCWCGRRSTPSRCEGLRYHPRKIFENSDAKSCILVTTWQYLLWNFLLFEIQGQEVGGPIHCWSPSLKVGGPVSPGPYGCFAYLERGFEPNDLERVYVWCMTCCPPQLDNFQQV